MSPPEAVSAGETIEFDPAARLVVEADRIGQAVSLSGRVGSSSLPPTLEPQLQTALEQAMTSRPTTLRIALDPPELGSLAIEVVERAGRIEIRIETETASTGRLLHDHLQPLRELALRTLPPSDQPLPVEIEIIETGSRDERSRESRRDGQPGQDQARDPRGDADLRRDSSDGGDPSGRRESTTRHDASDNPGESVVGDAHDRRRSDPLVAASGLDLQA